MYVEMFVSASDSLCLYFKVYSYLHTNAHMFHCSSSMLKYVYLVRACKIKKPLNRQMNDYSVASLYMLQKHEFVPLAFFLFLFLFLFSRVMVWCGFFWRYLSTNVAYRERLKKKADHNPKHYKLRSNMFLGPLILNLIFFPIFKIKGSPIKNMI